MTSHFKDTGLEGMRGEEALIAWEEEKFEEAVAEWQQRASEETHRNLFGQLDKHVHQEGETR